MARKKTSKAPQYGEPTSSVTVRIPSTLHAQIITRAKRDRRTKSRKIVELLTDAIGPLPELPDAVAVPEESVFE